MCAEPFSQSGFLCICTALRQEVNEKRAEDEKQDFQFEAYGFVSKPSVAWLNYTRTRLITSLSGACQRLLPKNKTWHIKKFTICFEWWQHSSSAPSSNVIGLRVTTWTPLLLNLPVPLTPCSSMCSGPSGHHYPRLWPCVRPDPVAVCTHIKHWLLTNMQRWWDVDSGIHCAPSYMFCVDPQGVCGNIHKRECWPPAPLGGAAESRLRERLLCWWNSCLHSHPVIAGH